jgi:hypothetical protein
MKSFRESIVVTNTPTQEIMDKAKKENQMVFTFIHQPESVVDMATSKAFQDGWLTALGLAPNHRLALITIPRELDLASATEAYLNQLEKATIPTFKMAVFK